MSRDGHMPHRYPTPAPDGEVIAWKCAACGEWINEYARKPGAECTVDWRNSAAQD